MNSFKGFVIKEFYHILRDVRSLLILFGMPIIMLILFGFALRNEVKDAEIAVLDQSKDHVTAGIIQNFQATDHFIVSESLHSMDDIEDAFQGGTIKQVVIFEPDFARKLGRNLQADIRVIGDASDPNTAQMLFQYTRAAVMDFMRMEQQTYGFSGIGIETETRYFYNPELESVNLFVPGLIAVILMLISTLMTSISITREKEMGSMEVLLVSPLKPYQIILGKVVPYLVLSIINVITVLLLARWVFEVPFEGSIPLFMGISLIFIVTALSLGVFISTKANNQLTAMFVALAGLLLPTVLLSGFIFPISSMPWILQWISHLVPARWFLVIVKGIMLKGVGITYFWTETLVLTGMALFFIMVSVKNFKIRLQ